jgi:hypothetical protein
MKKLLLRLAIPILVSLAEELAAKDENSTGWDDETAEAIKIALEKLAKYEII